MKAILSIRTVLICVAVFGAVWGGVGGNAVADEWTGDVSHDCRITLEDAILSLQTVSGDTVSLVPHSDADVSGDRRIGLPEALYALRVVALDLPLSVDCEVWDETAVRKVLQTFAWGGHPSDEQVRQWADMSPRGAVEQIMTFDRFNPALSPPDTDNLDTLTDGTLEGLADLFYSDNPDNPVDPDDRHRFDVERWSGPRYNWLAAIRSRGMNTFLHRIGFWESNYHMSVNQDVGIYPHPIIRHYDNIIGALTDGKAYQEVMAQGALNAAIAYQYGHNHNVFFNDVFRGNDDFAREFHQLFFGILGDYDHAYHESVSIEGTAMALTGIRANWHPDEEGGPDVEVYFAADVHHVDPIEILHSEIIGPTAEEKIKHLAEVAILHPESLDNVPVMIVESLADDNLTDEKKAAVHRLWKSLGRKDLLEFLRRYAISEVFHSPDRFKYHTSFDKHLFIHNQMLLANRELYDEFNPVRDLFSNDSVTPFYPVHNVFGHQTGAEAFNSPTFFKNVYNTSTDWYWYYTRVDRDDSDYRKEWQTIVPESSNGTYMVRDVAQWLWQRFVADGWKNYGALEEAHLYALLATGHDLGYYFYDTLPGRPDPTTVYTPDSFADPLSPPSLMVRNAGDSFLEFDSGDSETRLEANERVQLAIAFIAAIPYTYLEEGR